MNSRGKSDLDVLYIFICRVLEYGNCQHRPCGQTSTDALPELDRSDHKSDRFTDPLSVLAQVLLSVQSTNFLGSHGHLWDLRGRREIKTVLGFLACIFFLLLPCLSSILSSLLISWSHLKSHDINFWPLKPCKYYCQKRTGRENLIWYRFEQIKDHAIGKKLQQSDALQLECPDHLSSQLCCDCLRTSILFTTVGPLARVAVTALPTPSSETGSDKCQCAKWQQRDVSPDSYFCRSLSSQLTPEWLET